MEKYWFAAEIVLVHYAPFALYVLVLLIILGAIGSSLGLQNLFRDDLALVEKLTRENRSIQRNLLRSGAAFWGQLFISIFSGLLIALCYFCELGRDRHFIVGSVWDLFTDSGFNFSGDQFQGNHFLYTIFKDKMFQYLKNIAYTRTGAAHTDMMPWVLFFSALNCCVGLIGLRRGIPRSRGKSGSATDEEKETAKNSAFAHAPLEPVRIVLGSISGTAVVVGLFFLAFLLERAARGGDLEAWIDYHFQGAWGHIGFLSLFLIAMVLSIFTLFIRRLIACVGFLSLLLALQLLYFGISALPAPLQTVGITIILLYAIVVSGNFYLIFHKGTALKFPISGLEKYYITRGSRVPFFKAPLANRESIISDESSRPEFRGIDPLEQLDNWLQSHKERFQGRAKPKLVLLALSGGAYRSTFWAGMILDEIARMEREGEIKAFCSGVRIICGASGGMIAGAYAAHLAAKNVEAGSNWLARDDLDNSWRGIIEQITDDIERDQLRYLNPIPRDSLSTIVQRMSQRDIPSFLFPGRVFQHRGAALEAQWGYINADDAVFSERLVDERDARCPTLVFSPMIVESGRPLFISNLDVKSIRPDPSQAEHFFEHFPDCRSTVKLSTAARLSANFPYISPCTAVPTDPYNRVVDAGYYDNYGIDFAISYLSNDEVKSWIVQNSVEVVVVEIRAFPRVNHGGTSGSAGMLSRVFESVRRSMQWLTTPIEGVLVARGATMTFKNDQAFERLAKNYPVNLRLINFELGADLGLSWYLTQYEYEMLKEEIERRRRKQFLAVREIFS